MPRLYIIEHSSVDMHLTLCGMSPCVAALWGQSGKRNWCADDGLHMFKIPISMGVQYIALVVGGGAIALFAIERLFGRGAD